MPTILSSGTTKHASTTRKYKNIGLLLFGAARYFCEIALTAEQPVHRYVQGIRQSAQLPVGHGPFLTLEEGESRDADVDAGSLQLSQQLLLFHALTDTRFCDPRSDQVPVSQGKLSRFQNATPYTEIIGSKGLDKFGITKYNKFNLARPNNTETDGGERSMAGDTEVCWRFGRNKLFIDTEKTRQRYIGLPELRGDSAEENFLRNLRMRAAVCQPFFAAVGIAPEKPERFSVRMIDPFKQAVAVSGFFPVCGRTELPAAGWPADADAPEEVQDAMESSFGFVFSPCVYRGELGLYFEARLPWLFRLPIPVPEKSQPVRLPALLDMG